MGTGESKEIKSKNTISKKKKNIRPKKKEYIPKVPKETKFNLAIEKNIRVVEDTRITSVLCFPSEKKVVSGGSCIRVWDLESGECLQKIPNNTDDHRRFRYTRTRQLIKWDESTFLCSQSEQNFSGISSSLLSFSMKPLCEAEKVFKVEGSDISNVGFILKLNRDLFVFSCSSRRGYGLYESKIVVMRYSSEEVVRTINPDNFECSPRNRFSRSINFWDCFYSNDCKWNNINMLNYKTGIQVKEFLTHHNPVNTVNVFLNSKNEEILVYDGEDGILYFCNVGSKWSNNRILEDESTKVIQKIRVKKRISCTHCLDEKGILCVGDFLGNLHLYSLRDLEMNNINKKLKKLEHPGQFGFGENFVSDISFFKGEEGLKLLCGYTDCYIFVYSATGTFLTYDRVEFLEKQDLKERIEFILFDSESFLEDESFFFIQLDNKRKMNQQLALCEEAVNYIKPLLKDINPTIGLVLGTGMDVISEEMTDVVEIKYCDIPGFKESSVKPENSVLVAGKIGERHCILQKYRYHFYEGYSMQEITFPIRVFAMLGCRNILLTNASGTVNKNYKPGDYMILDDHINFSGANPLFGKNVQKWGRRFIGCEDLYDKKINDEFLKRALEWKKTRKVVNKDEEDFQMHVGCYMMFGGPSFETKKEIHFARVIGADVVGMSTVPEAIVAQHMDLTITAFSFCTNYGAGVSEVEVDHEKVIMMAENMKEVSKGLVRLLIPLLVPNEKKLESRRNHEKSL